MADQTDTTATDKEVDADTTATDTANDAAKGGQATDKAAGDQVADKDAKGGDDKSRKDAGTVLDGEDADDGVATPGDFPADWREKMAGDDKKKMATLKRFESPKALYAAYESLRQKMATGEIKSALPDDATDEQKAEWRKANGIPEAPDKYEIKLSDGLTIGEADRPLVDDYLKAAHALNHTPAQVNANLEWYFNAVEAQKANIAEANKQARADCEDELRAEWGAEFRGNKNMIKAYIDQDADLSVALQSAVQSDGTALLNNPVVMRYLAKQAREEMLAGVIVGADGSAGTAGMEDRIAEIEKMMHENRDAYNKDEKIQAELRRLYDAREKLASKAA